MEGMHMLPILPGSQPIGVLAIYKFKIDWNHLTIIQNSFLNKRRSTGRCWEQMLNKCFPALKYREKRNEWQYQYDKTVGKGETGMSCPSGYQLIRKGVTEEPRGASVAKWRAGGSFWLQVDLFLVGCGSAHLRRQGRVIWQAVLRTYCWEEGRQKLLFFSHGVAAVEGRKKGCSLSLKCCENPNSIGFKRNVWFSVRKD